jgi:hypothetical protein
MIKEIVADFYHISVDQIDGKSQKEEIVWPRHVAIYCIHRLTRLTHVEIGKNFGGREHSTVWASIEKIKSRMIYSDKIAKEVDSIVADIENQIKSCVDLFVKDIDMGLSILRKKLVDVVSNTPHEILVEIMNEDIPASERMERLLTETSKGK